MNDKGISVDGINKTIVSLNYYIDVVKSSLDDISVQMSAVNTYYKSSVSKALIDRYNELSFKYQSLYDKMRNYCTLLETNINSYGNHQEETVSYFNDADKSVSN